MLISMWLTTPNLRIQPFPRRGARRNGCISSLWASGTKLNFPCMSRTQNTKNIFFNWLHFFFSWLFLYHREYTSLFQLVKLCMTIFLSCEIGDAQFYRELKYANLVERKRPFYRYGGHTELIRFKEYYRVPRGHEHISFVFSSAVRDIFS